MCEKGVFVRKKSWRWKNMKARKLAADHVCRARAGRAVLPSGTDPDLLEFGGKTLSLLSEGSIDGISTTAIDSINCSCPYS
jgi:hypothetical protein